MKKKSAFSLIELSIVVLIIGIIITSVIGGRKLIILSNLNKARALTNSSPVNGIEDLALWLESTSKNSFISLPNDGANITNWYDINPQLTVKRTISCNATCPTYIASGINSLPAIRFDGTINNFISANLDIN